MSSLVQPFVGALLLRGVILPERLERDLYVVDGRITFQPPVGSVQTVLAGGCLLPGLVDAHAHLGLASPAPPSATPTERVRASARIQLAAGVLLIREPGGPDHASRVVGPAEGLPRTITGGRLLAPAGRYFPGLAREVSDDHLPAAAEEEARISGAWAKVVGDFVGTDGRLSLNYRPATLAEAARRVHAVGARIAIHATTTDTISAAIDAGFDSIEHGIGLRDEHFRAMIAGDVTLVPTLSIANPATLPMMRGMLSQLGMISPFLESALRDIEGHLAAVGRAHRAGVRILAGTDAGMGPHGMIREEIRLLRDAGLAAHAALGAASWDARRFLGFSAIEEGAPADLVAYADDPRVDPTALERPLVVLLDGRLVFAPSALSTAA